ncbi:MAG: GGDEF domain-containing protein [Planctomycetes bacterium]|nr:GGDEF domain-containing protein [Planctomycetota bacterium]
MPSTAIPEFFSEFAKLGEDCTVPEGAVLWEEGDAAGDVLLLLEGGLEVTHRTPQGNIIVLGLLEAGAVVGELACFDGLPRSATVHARTPCRFLRISGNRFIEVLQRYPKVLSQFLWLEIQRIRHLTDRFAATYDRAITDPLTRLYNRAFFQDRLRMELSRAAQMGDVVSVVFFDIDQFKEVNDGLGHPAGDQVLARTADLLRETARRGDIVARYGGDEFAALLYGANSLEAYQIAELARVRLEADPPRSGADGRQYRVTLSAGVAVFPSDAPDREGVLKAADLKLYEAKSAGRNRVAASI